MRCAWLPVLFLLLIVPARAGHSPPKVFLRIFIQTAGEGLPDTQAIKITLPPGNEQIQIRALPELTEHDLNAVQVDAAGATHLRFDYPGQINLSAVTGQNQGRILVVFIDGVAVYAPVIDEQITNGELVVPHPLQPNIISLLQEVAKENVRQTAKT
jgi:hypothetical protein